MENQINIKSIPDEIIEKDIAYLAGLVDGEGSIVIHRTNKAMNRGWSPDVESFIPDRYAEYY